MTPTEKLFAELADRIERAKVVVLWHRDADGIEDDPLSNADTAMIVSRLRASTDRALTPALTADEIESLEALRDHTSENAVLDYSGGKGRTASGKAVEAINRALALLSPQDGAER